MNLDPTWNNVFKLLIFLFIGLTGAPVTQAIKNLLSMWLKKPVEDRPALLLTAVVSVILALIEMLLNRQIDFSTITAVTFPALFFSVFALASLYYAWLKGSEGIFGRGLLLKPYSPKAPVLEATDKEPAG